VSTTITAPDSVPAHGPARNVVLHYTAIHPHRPNSLGGGRWAFVFSDQEPSDAFYCSLDRSSFSQCGSPQVYRHLKRGRHVFSVKAISVSGEESAVRKVDFDAGRRRRPSSS
jgi:hypothetical protein